MKNIFLFVLFLTLAVEGLAQGKKGTGEGEVYIPRQYNAIAATGDSLFSSLIADINTADTSRPVILQGWSQVHLVLSQATGTAGGLIVKFQGSNDGVNFGTNLITLDSLNWTAATALKSFDLSSKCGGFYAVRFVINGSTGPAFTGTNRYSAIIRKKK